MNQAQTAVYKTFPRTIHFLQRYDLEYNNYNDISPMTNGHIVVANGDSRCVKIVDSNGEIRMIIKLDAKAENDSTLSGIVKIDENKIAMSSSQTISIINIGEDTSTVAKTLLTNSKLSGITFTGGDIVFCVPETGLKSVNIETTKIKTIIVDNTICSNSHVVANGTRICYTCPWSNTVVVMDMSKNIQNFHKNVNNFHHNILDSSKSVQDFHQNFNHNVLDSHHYVKNFKCPKDLVNKNTDNDIGVKMQDYKVVFKFEDETMLRFPTGITMDERNNVYVTGHLSHNLVVISPEGETFFQLLWGKDGLHYPTAVKYDFKSENLIVITKQNGQICRYFVE